MKEFLIRLKLIDYMTTTLHLSKIDFINRLRAITDEGSTRRLSDHFNIFAPSPFEFKGEVNLQGFKIKKRKKVFDSNLNISEANGTYTEENGTLKIETEINGFNNFYIFYYVFIILIYAVFLVLIMRSGGETEIIAILFLLIHGAFMLGLPYLMMRKSVQRMQYELEREFYYLTKTN